MSETVQNKNLSHKKQFCRNSRGSDIKKTVISSVITLFITLTKYLILFLEYTLEVLKTFVNQPHIFIARGTQTADCQDLIALITHHFGALHEENYIKKIVQKSQWNKMTSEIVMIKDQMHRQNDYLNSLKVEIKELSHAVETLKNMIVFSNSNNRSIPFNASSDQISFIPPPPPLPPPGFISSAGGAFKPCQSLKKKIFEENFPPRPLITVESLKEVKLKKIPSPRSPKNVEKEEEKDLLPAIRNLRKIQNEFGKKRPKTADCPKIKQKTNMTISPPRPLTSDN